MASIGWLHLANLHLTVGGEHTLDDLIQDLEVAETRAGDWVPLDLILISGDLSASGTSDDFAAVDRAVDRLLRRLRDLLPDPKIIAVPGNHDLVRPGFDSPARVLHHWERSTALKETFWTDADSPFRRAIARAFDPFCRWSEARMPGVTRGLLPGDFTTTFEKDGLLLGIAGINSAFLHLDDLRGHGDLEIDARQLDAAAGGDVPSWIARHHAAFLITHHPPSSLSEAGRAAYVTGINPPGRFHVHFSGHAHGAKDSTVEEEPNGFLRVSVPSVPGRLEYTVGRLRATGGHPAQTTMEIWSHARYPHVTRTTLFRSWPRETAPAADTPAPPPTLELTELRDVLVALYPSPRNAQRVARDAGLDGERIPRAGAAVDVWHAVLLEAERSGKAEQLEEMTLLEYGNHPPLKAAWDALRGARSRRSWTSDPPPAAGEESEQVMEDVFQRAVRLRPEQIDVFGSLLGVSREKLSTRNASTTARVAEILREAEKRGSGADRISNALAKVSGSLGHPLARSVSGGSYESLRHVPSPARRARAPWFELPFKPRPASVRRLLNDALPDEREFDAFCLEAFPELYRRFTNGMDRHYRTSLLVERAGPEEVIRRLRRARPEAFAEHADSITYDE